ncbi:MAG: hypothetical protein RMK94_02940, partial [Armatimonadota bacterium]|nr:hypothetical protein [Armatimonadota bacterium]
MWEEPCAGHAKYAIIAFKEACNIVQRVCDTNGSMSPRWTQKLMQLVSEWDGDRALIRLLQSERVVHLQFF